MNEPVGRDPALTEVFLDRLSLRAQMGVYAHEKGRTQPLVVSIRAWARLSLEDDALSQTIDYNAFADAARELAETGHFQLIETYVEALADALMRDERLQMLDVRAEKPEAVLGAAAAGVAIFRRR